MRAGAERGFALSTDRVTMTYFFLLSDAAVKTSQNCTVYQVYLSTIRKKLISPAVTQSYVAVSPPSGMRPFTTNSQRASVKSQRQDQEDNHYKILLYVPDQNSSTATKRPKLQFNKLLLRQRISRISAELASRMESQSIASGTIRFGLRLASG